VNDTLGRKGVPMLMMRDDRYAVAVADAFSRLTHRGVLVPRRRQCRWHAVHLPRDGAGLEDGSPVLCITDGMPAGSWGNAGGD
jgi:hypothetical protein